MPITTSAKKALRGSRRKQVFNLRHKKEVQDAVKNVRKFVTEKKHAEALTALSSAYKAIDKAAKTNFLKKNTAARKKSRLAALINKATR